MNSAEEDYCVHFANDSGQSVVISIVGYEFPHEELGPTDDNPTSDFDPARFLMVKTDWNDGNQKWSVMCPLLTTVDLQAFSDWLDTLARGVGKTGGVPFTERDLEVTFDRRLGIVVVHASGSCLPTASATVSMKLDFPVRDLDLESMIQSLKMALAEFPSRPRVA